MAYGDTQEMCVHLVMKINTNNGTDVNLVHDPNASQSPAFVGSGKPEPPITSITLFGAGPLMPAAGGPDRYEFEIRKLR